MAEYISKEEALKFLAQQANEAQKDADENGGESVIYAECLEDAIADFERLPAADVAPVRLGRWVPFHSEAAGDIQYCSACKIGNTAKSDFCPHCGAIMDGGVSDEVN